MIDVSGSSLSLDHFQSWSLSCSLFVGPSDCAMANHYSLKGSNLWRVEESLVLCTSLWRYVHSARAFLLIMLQGG